MRKSVSDSLDKLVRAIASANPDPADPELQAYLSTAFLRKSLGNAWLSETMQEVQAALALPSTGKETSAPAAAAVPPAESGKDGGDSQSQTEVADAESQSGGGGSLGTLR